MLGSFRYRRGLLKVTRLFFLFSFSHLLPITAPAVIDDDKLSALISERAEQNRLLRELLNQNRNIIESRAAKKKLFFMPDDYDKRTLPPKVNQGEVNKIHVTIDIYGIPQLDEKLEEIMLELKISHMWTDLRLNTTMMKRPVELEPATINEFWTPDSYFHHAKAAKSVQLMTQTASLRVRPDKKIQYTMMTLITLGCPMSFYNYPMDKQTCRLELQSFGYDLHHNNYSWRRPPQMKKDITLDNHDVGIVDYTFTYSTEGLPYPGLGVRIELKRHLGFHITQTYIPSIIFVIVAWMSFHVPSDVVPGRMVLCVTTLLTLISMLNSVRSLTPQVSYMKAVDLWVFVCLVFVFSSLAEYGVILYLTSRSGWQKKVDADIKTISGSKYLMSIYPSNMIRVFTGGKLLRPKEAYNNNHEETLTLAPTIPKNKERIAYSLEYMIKIIYPLAFVVFNYFYWSHYLKSGPEETDPGIWYG